MALISSSSLVFPFVHDESAAVSRTQLTRFMLSTIITAAQSSDVTEEGVARALMAEVLALGTHLNASECTCCRSTGAIYRRFHLAGCRLASSAEERRLPVLRGEPERSELAPFTGMAPLTEKTRGAPPASRILTCHTATCGWRSQRSEQALARPRSESAACGDSGFRHTQHFWESIEPTSVDGLPALRLSSATDPANAARL
jgi:hypothetical protein